MRSSFADLNVAMRALMANQLALSVTGHNIANANTVGYSRQELKLTTSRPFPIPAFNRATIVGQLGTGVQAAMILRHRNAFIDLQLRLEEESLSQWRITQDVLRQAELYFHEPSSDGLNTALSRFWSSWTELGNNPESAAVRQTLRENAADLANTFNNTYQRLQALRQDMNQQIRLKVQEVNSLAARIAGLNEQIVKVQSIGYQPNDLRDQRDALVDELSRLISISYVETANGNLAISIGGRNLVFGRDSYDLSVAADPSNDNMFDIRWGEDGTEVTVFGGALKGLQNLRDDYLPNLLGRLNEMASALASEVNAIHRTGFGLDGSTGLDFFSVTAGSEAATITLAGEVAADIRRIASAVSAGAIGDGSIALAIANLQTAKVMGGGTVTISGFYNGLISQLGVDTSNAKAMTVNQSLLVQHLSERKEEESGVSLDEEAINLVRYERAFQAASRMVTAIDEMLDRVINNMGLVGR